jgi:hypothetical protein
MKKTTILATGAAAALLSPVHADVVNADDVIVQGSLAVGFDAVNNENFGFDTVRLKENNLRIKFEDTSTGAFPSNDWQLTANDTTSGGKSRFSIDDVTNSKTPFTVEASAPSNSLYVASSGKIGFGNSSPVLGLHQTGTDTPALRFEQTNAGGFSAQTWDVAGNEANFFVRDVTGGSKLPFRIQPGAPTSTLYLANSGNVGLGLTNPAADLHISRNDGGTSIRLSNTVATTGSNWDVTVTDAGTFVLQKDGQTAKYSFGGDGSLSITRPGAFGSTFSILNVDTNGNVTAGGTISGTSDVTRKENFGTVDPDEILEKLAKVPVKTWSYKGEPVTHVGPMAQDFHQAFEVGASERSISMADADGVALASIQALHRQSQEKDRRISELKSANEKLEARLQRLERLIESRN